MFKPLIYSMNSKTLEAFTTYEERDFDEGLGTVYERFMLNSFFDSLVYSYQLKKVLEVPFYGMTGLTGINSVHLVERGCKLTIVDSKKEKVNEAVELWKGLPYEGRCEVVYHEDLSRLPFEDKSFDLVWDFAALWHVKEAEKLLCEMARVSSRFVLVFVPNKRQIGYLLRKYVFDRNFFETVDEKWADIERISDILTSQGLDVKDRGVLDIPPWPDTCVPLRSILDKLNFVKMGNKKKEERRWKWDIVSYYLGKDRTVKERVERFSFIERSKLPLWLKALWAHHRYIIFSKN